MLPLTRLLSSDATKAVVFDGEAIPDDIIRSIFATFMRLVSVARHRVKVALVGDGGVGKTSYVRALNEWNHEKKYIATQGADVSPIHVLTPYGVLTFDIWDAAGPEKFGGLREVMYASFAIIVFDLTSRLTYRNVSNWKRDVHRVAEEAFIVVVGNKVDVKERRVKREQVTFPRKNKLPYHETSCRTNQNLLQPFLDYARHFYVDPTMEFLPATDYFLEGAKEPMRLAHGSAFPSVKDPYVDPDPVESDDDDF